MKNLFLFIAVLVMISCSSNEITEQTAEAIDQKSTCNGYGVSENVEYDCGWKRGYDDWVYHYNRTVDDLGYDPCHKVQVLVVEPVESEEIYRIRLVYGAQTDFTATIIQVTQNNNQSYYNDLFNDLSTDFLRGKADGYQWGRGQEPLAANDPDCFF